MPAPKLPEFRRRADELARLREKPIAEIARDLRISESCLPRWMIQADVDERHKRGPNSNELADLAISGPSEEQSRAGLSPAPHTV